MTLLFGIPLSVLVGLIVTRPQVRSATVVAIWFVCLAAQTAYLAEPGRTGFGGANGTDALTGPVYWIIQSVLLCASITIASFVASVVDRRRSRQPNQAQPV